MTSTQNKRQQNRRLFNQLQDFDRDNSFGEAVSRETQNLDFNDGVDDQTITAYNIDRIAITNENTKHIQTLKEVALVGLLEKWVILLKRLKI